MSEDVWSARDTTPAKVDAALRDLLVERHRENEAYVPARVLNMVAVVDDEFRGEIENRLDKVGRFHPSRLILCRVRKGQTTLDAHAKITAEDAPKDGEIAVTHEQVELKIGPEHLKALQSIVDPLIVSDVATMAWAPHGHAEAVDALRRIAQVVLFDSLEEPDVEHALRRAQDLNEDLYVVDLAWLRSTPWRERVAAAFDPPQHRVALGSISSVTVRHRADSGAAAVLFCGWLASRLGWRPEPMVKREGGWSGKARARRGEVTLRLEPADLGSPGLGGVTIESANGELVSLDRAEGGLQEVRRDRKVQVLGASRGEGGILGEGVRQALLRDHTYVPALEAAQAMVA